MKKRLKEYSKILFVSLAFLCLSGFFSDGILLSTQVDISSFPTRGRVDVVYDGDTIKVRFNDGQEWRVRLIGIDAPEIGDVREDMKFKAEMSKRFTFYHLYRKKIRLSYESELFDSYGRILAYIWIDEQDLFNKFIISEGFASAYANFRFSYREEFKEIEKEARSQEKGYWKHGNYTRIQEEEVESHIGQIVSLEFTCVSVRLKGKFYYLNSDEGEFQTIIPKANLSLFPLPQFYRGKVLSVTGFLEEYKGKPQIMAFFPSQIEMEEN
ncbi:MAG: thermonuclease family protein [Candidatus Aminicenantes bacterium]|jgi:micrococcal nuclease